MNRKPFFIVPNEIFEYKLTAVSFFVYCCLRRCDNRERGCFPSKRTIAAMSGISVSSVSRSIKRLEECGLISVTHNFADGRQRNNSYAFPMTLALCHRETGEQD